MIKTSRITQSLIQNARDGLAAYDVHRKLLICNRTYAEDIERLFGIRPEVGGKLESFLAASPDDAADAIARWRRAISGETVTLTREWGAPGRLRALRTIGYGPLYDDGALVGIWCVSHPPRHPDEHASSSPDAPELIARDAMESRDRLRVLDLIPIGIAHMALDGEILHVNQRLGEILGYSRAALIGMNFRDLSHPDDRNDSREQIRRVVSGEIRLGTVEKRYRHHDGQTIWVRLMFRIVPGPDAVPAYLLLVIEDITQWRATLDALDASERELRRLAEEAHTARMVAEQASLDRSRFLAAASHDLRQPAQSLSLFAAVLERRLAGKPEAEVVARLNQAIEALSTLLDALLDVSKLDAGIITPDVADIPVDSVLDRLAGDYAGQAATHNLRLRRVPTRAKVRTDPALLERILRNLIENALRYTAHGSVLVGCRRRGTTHLDIWVVDSGIGIPPEHLQSVFDDFVQVGNPERDRSLGLGLGLAIVRRLAELLGHELGVASVLGRGSRFSVTLPLVLPPNPAILVIDDEDLVRQALHMILESWGYRVWSAASAEEALAITTSLETLDAVIADYRLEQDAPQTGEQVVEELRKRFGATLPAILLTGDTNPALGPRAGRSRLALLHKPVRTDALHQTLTQLLTSGPNNRPDRPPPGEP